MNQKEILGSSHLNGFGDFWEHVFDVEHICLCGFSVLSALVQDLVDKVLVFNDILDIFSSFLMCINKVNDDIILPREAIEQRFFKQQGEEFVLPGEPLNELDETVRYDVCRNEIPVLQWNIFMIEGSVS